MTPKYGPQTGKRALTRSTPRNTMTAKPTKPNVHYMCAYRELKMLSWSPPGDRVLKKRSEGIRWHMKAEEYGERPKVAVIRMIRPAAWTIPP
jgi:hypothetical protein